MAFTSNEWMVIVGAGLVLLGFLIRWRTGRHDLGGAAIESAWQTARGRRTTDNPTEIERKLKNITAQSTAAGKVTAAATTVVGHVFAQAMGTMGLLMMLGGALLVAAGLWWR